jgi:hypothetical protein
VEIMTSKPYGDVTTARKLAGNFDDTDISDTEIQQIIAFSDSHVDAETARMGTGWDNTDSAYPMVQNASNYFAAAEIISRYRDDAGKGDAHYGKALDICLSIRESSPGSLIIASSAYKTYPLNLNANIYRSLPGAADSSNRQAVFGDDSDTVSP